jgi:hypothetical protein
MTMTTFTTTARRTAQLVVGAALALGSMTGAAHALDIANAPQDPPCGQHQICGDKGPAPEDDGGNGFEGPGDLADPCLNAGPSACDPDDTPDEPEIDDLAPEAPVPADPTFTG